MNPGPGPLLMVCFPILQDDAATSVVSRSLKSPTSYHQQKSLALKAMEKKVDDYYEKEVCIIYSYICILAVVLAWKKRRKQCVKIYCKML